MKDLGYRNLASGKWALLIAFLIVGLISLPVVSAFAQSSPIFPDTKPQLFTVRFLVRLLVNAVAVILLVRFVYFPMNHKKEFYFTFFLLNSLVFVVIFLVNIGTTIASTTGFGLIAIFTLLRFRTTTISIKDMTYLVIVLFLATINATMTGPTQEMIAVNVFIIALTYSLDKEWLSKSIHTQEMELSSLEHIMPQDLNKLISDLRVRTGLDVQRVKIESVDLVKGRAIIKLYYY
jgi:hypothetical protein